MFVIFKGKKDLEKRIVIKLEIIFVYFPQISNMIFHTYYIRIKEHVNYLIDFD